MTTSVGEPFASDPGFWASVRASGYALVTLVASALVTVLLGRAWAACFLVPLALLVRAAFTGRASARRSRTAFPSRQEWRDAERDAVAHAFVSALTGRDRRPPLPQAKNTAS